MRKVNRLLILVLIYQSEVYYDYKLILIVWGRLVLEMQRGPLEFFLSSRRLRSCNSLRMNICRRPLEGERLWWGWCHLSAVRLLAWTLAFRSMAQRRTRCLRLLPYSWRGTLFFWRSSNSRKCMLLCSPGAFSFCQSCWRDPFQRIRLNMVICELETTSSSLLRSCRQLEWELGLWPLWESWANHCQWPCQPSSPSLRAYRPRCEISRLCQNLWVWGFHVFYHPLDYQLPGCHFWGPRERILPRGQFILNQLTVYRCWG